MDGFCRVGALLCRGCVRSFPGVYRSAAAPVGEGSERGSFSVATKPRVKLFPTAGRFVVEMSGASRGRATLRPAAASAANVGPTSTNAFVAVGGGSIFLELLHPGSHAEIAAETDSVRRVSPENA